MNHVTAANHCKPRGEGGRPCPLVYDEGGEGSMLRYVTMGDVLWAIWQAIKRTINRRKDKDNG